jgi:hypothetical protein
MISMNVFPNALGSPDSGGTFDLVAKTDSPFGISAISFYVKNIDTAGLVIQSDIGQLSGLDPFFATFGGAHNLVYAQDTAFGPVVLGVGTLATSDGPDPLGDPAWNNATLIISGTYSSVVPMFATSGDDETDANTFSTLIGPPYNAAIDPITVTTVRVAVPEPAAGVLGGIVLAAAALLGRRRG